MSWGSMNLPDDWGSYFHTCEKCGKRYHSSGTEQCDCIPCECCGELVAPGEGHGIEEVSNYINGDGKPMSVVSVDTYCTKCLTCEECGKFDEKIEYHKEAKKRLCAECFGPTGEGV